MRKEKRQGKRYLPTSNLRMEVLDPLPHRWCCLDASGHVLPYPCVNVLTDPGKREFQDAGHQRGAVAEVKLMGSKGSIEGEKESGATGLVPEEPAPLEPANPSEGRPGGSRCTSAGTSVGTRATPYTATLKISRSIRHLTASRQVRQSSVECPQARWKLQNGSMLCQCGGGFDDGRIVESPG